MEEEQYEVTFRYIKLKEYLLGYMKNQKYLLVEGQQLFYINERHSDLTYSTVWYSEDSKVERGPQL